VTGGTRAPIDAGTARQRALLVLGSSARFDARAHRISSTLAARGHHVTMIGRLEPGLPAREVRSDGVVVLRVPASAPDGLPLPGVLRDPLAERWAARAGRGRRAAGPGGGGAAGRPTPSPPAARGSGAARGGAIDRVRRAASGIVRIAAVVLTVRSQARRARAVAPEANVVFGMGFMGLPVALGIAPHGAPPVVYDAGDVYVEAGNIARLPLPVRRAFGWLEGRWARRAILVATANDGYADVIAARYGLRRPLVLLNCPPLERTPDPSDSPLRAAAGMPPGRRVVLYHGGFSPDRGIEQLLTAIGDVPDASLVLLGYGSLGMSLRQRVAGQGLADRVAILDAVPQDELLAWIAGADVAAMPIQPTTLNHRLTVPNKLFEAMAAGVPVVASDLPGMAPIVRGTGCGILVDPTDPAAIAVALRRVLDAPPEERAAWREGGLRAVRERYSWEHEEPRLLAALGEATGNAW
jgi:glycogen(starch) synthase